MPDLRSRIQIQMNGNLTMLLQNGNLLVGKLPKDIDLWATVWSNSPDWNPGTLTSYDFTAGSRIFPIDWYFNNHKVLTTNEQLTIGGTKNDNSLRYNLAIYFNNLNLDYNRDASLAPGILFSDAAGSLAGYYTDLAKGVKGAAVTFNNFGYKIMRC